MAEGESAQIDMKQQQLEALAKELPEDKLKADLNTYRPIFRAAVDEVQAGLAALSRDLGDQDVSDFIDFSGKSIMQELIAMVCTGFAKLELLKRGKEETLLSSHNRKIPFYAEILSQESAKLSGELQKIQAELTRFESFKKTKTELAQIEEDEKSWKADLDKPTSSLEDSVHKGEQFLVDLTEIQGHLPETMISADGNRIIARLQERLETAAQRIAQELKLPTLKFDPVRYRALLEVEVEKKWPLSSKTPLSSLLKKKRSWLNYSRF